MMSAKNDLDLMNELLEPEQVVLRCKVGEIFFCLNNICQNCYLVSKAEALRYLEVEKVVLGIERRYPLRIE